MIITNYIRFKQIGSKVQFNTHLEHINDIVHSNYTTALQNPFSE